jgi:hypothetical protein
MHTQRPLLPKRHTRLLHLYTARVCAMLLCVGLLIHGATGGETVTSTPELTLDFDTAAVDHSPAGFSTALTGRGGPGAWRIMADATAPSGGKVLAQTSTDKTSYRFPLCVYDQLAATDVTVSVRFKKESPMQRTWIARLWTALTLVAVALVWHAALSMAAEGRPDTATIERLTGIKGELNEQEGVFTVRVPRTDLDVRVAGVQLTPPLGLTSWAAFQKAGAQTMVMGDMVLLEDQVNLVMSVALENGLAVTALHNHFFWDAPKVMFMHIGGMGDAATLAGAVGKVFARIKETSGGKGEVPRADISPAQTSLDPKVIEDTLGVKGQMASGVYKVAIGRTTRMVGHEVGNAMGVNTWAAFAGSDDKAVVDGDFAMAEHELQPVLKALRGAGIHVVAIHQHMTLETPRIVFLHYWGIGSTRELAQGLKAALEAQRHA